MECRVFRLWRPAFGSVADEVLQGVERAAFLVDWRRGRCLSGTNGAGSDLERP